MGSNRDWLTSTEQNLVDLCNKWVSFGNDKGLIAAYGLDETKCAELSSVITSFLDARATYQKINSSVNRVTKDTAKKTAVAAIRKFTNVNIRYNDKIDETARAALGIRPRDTTPTVHPRPSIRPETVVENTKNRFEHYVKAICNENRAITKPKDVYGVRFAWKVGGEKPLGGEDLTKTKFSRRAALIVTFTEADKGKPVWYATCYENSRGEAGPWSLLMDAYIG